MDLKREGWKIKGAHMHQIVSFLSVHTRAKWRCKKARSNFWLQLQHISCSYRHRILDVSCVRICPDTDRSLLSPLHRHLVSPHQYHTWQDNEELCLVSLLSAIICIEVKFGHHVLFNLVGNPWFHSCGSPGRRKMVGRILVEEEPRQQLSSRPPRRISQMFPLTGYPCVCNLQPRNIITFSSKDILSECGKNEE